MNKSVPTCYMPLTWVFFIINWLKGSALHLDQPPSSLWCSHFNLLNISQCVLTPATFLYRKTFARRGRSRAGDQQCVWKRDRESVWLKVTWGLHHKAEVPLIRSEETVGLTAPCSRGGADQQHYCQCWWQSGHMGLLSNPLTIENVTFAA